MKRRSFITLLGGAVATWPLGARGQQASMPVIGFLNGGSAIGLAVLTEGFRRGLGEMGYMEGRNVLIEYRWGEGDYDRLPMFAAELVNRQVEVLVATGGTTTALVAKAATTTIPIVFQMGGDPVEIGIVNSFNLPGGNLTGVASLLIGLAPKRLELLKELRPGLSVIGLLANSQSRNMQVDVRNAKEAATSLGCSILVFNGDSDREIEIEFSVMRQRGVGALLILADPFMFGRQEKIATFAVRHAIPTVFPWPEAARRGGLISYGPSLPEMFRLVGVYTGRILKGAKASELPILQPTKFELVINLNTAKAIGLEVPPTLLARADEVIE
jgi:putative tryptophan/tyrosine transport system substrate-binding protein